MKLHVSHPGGIVFGRVFVSLVVTLTRNLPHGSASVRWGGGVCR